ncbi:cytochrome b-c1 complex subunit 9-like [Acomys russatus]|uniref:cytochrome b-c1 complex subunit 9-like n=1 Tax=Acomys russatus TaxID=60746 RepID=UPI0021E1F7C6|nr:cytochrome b-c1 complex subunit 9-like [Acomys russatus]
MAPPTITLHLYSLLFRRTSTFTLTTVVGTFLFKHPFCQGADAIYVHFNKGKLQKHIKHGYENKERVLPAHQLLCWSWGLGLRMSFEFLFMD